MKKNIVMVAVCLMLAACTGGATEQSASNNQDEPKEATPAVSQAQQAVVKVGFIASATSNAPLNFIGEDGSIQGFEYDILQEIAKRSNYKFEYDYSPDELLFDGLDSKKYKILSGNTTIDGERTGKYAMSNSYLDFYPVTIVSKNPNIKTLEDLKGQSISIKDSPVEGFDGYVAMNKPEEAAVHIVKSDWLAVKDVMSDKSVAAVSASSVAPYFVERFSDKKNPLYFSIDYSYPKEDYVFFLNQNDQKLLEAINAALASMKADGTYQNIFKKWF